MKKLEFDTKDCKTLVELLFRGLAYTDGFYSDYSKVKKVWNKTIDQLNQQGAKSVFNGKIKF